MMVFISSGKLHVSAYSGDHQVLTIFLLYEFYTGYRKRWTGFETAIT